MSPKELIKGKFYLFDLQLKVEYHYETINHYVFQYENDFGKLMKMELTHSQVINNVSEIKL